MALVKFFKRDNPSKDYSSSTPCPYCGSANTGLVLYHGGDRPAYVKVWRGQRVLTFRCFDCGRELYGEEGVKGVTRETEDGDRLIDDEEALRDAEDEIARQVDEGDDRMCR